MGATIHGEGPCYQAGACLLCRPAYELRAGGVLLNSRDMTPGAAVTAAVLSHCISPAAFLLVGFLFVLEHGVQPFDGNGWVFH